MFMEIPHNIDSKILKTESCWLWTGHVNNVGYGRYNKKEFVSGYIHRQMFYLANGYLPIIPNVVGHLCEVRKCVNPKHLTEQTQSANVRQYTEKITQCPNGHEYTKENTYMRSNGARKCKTCNREAERQRRGQ